MYIDRKEKKREKRKRRGKKKGEKKEKKITKRKKTLEEKKTHRPATFPRTGPPVDRRQLCAQREISRSFEQKSRSLRVAPKKGVPASSSLTFHPTLTLLF